MDPWRLTTVYGPCTEPYRSEFINWFRGHLITDSDNCSFLVTSISIDPSRTATSREETYLIP
jgi:hypothetical protein